MPPSVIVDEPIEEGQRFSVLSDGAFDISVQPLWRLYEAHFWSHSNVVDDIAARAQEVARELVDFRRIETGAARVAFARKGMGITLNSLAQGFITDAIADMLRNEDFESAVVDLGEFRTLGRHPDGHAWRIGIRDALSASGLARTVELDEMALAVSGGYGTTFEPSGRFHHIFDPVYRLRENHVHIRFVVLVTVHNRRLRGIGARDHKDKRIHYGVERQE